MKGKHWMLMVLGCGIPVIILAAVFVFQMQLSSVLLFGLVLFCPLVHLFMLRDHLGHSPPLPAMYSHGSIPLQAEVVLAPNTFSGAQLRRLVSLCAVWGIEAQLLLHDSEPQRRIEWAARTSDCTWFSLATSRIIGCTTDF